MRRVGRVKFGRGRGGSAADPGDSAGTMAGRAELPAKFAPAGPCSRTGWAGRFSKDLNESKRQEGRLGFRRGDGYGALPPRLGLGQLRSLLVGMELQRSV